MSRELEHPDSSKTSKLVRTGLQVASGVPVAGGVFSAIASAWSEKEQEKINRFLEYWIKMLADELREKEVTMIEIMSRLDLQDEKISKRLESKEYLQSTYPKIMKIENDFCIENTN